jgi:hypothetical protein
VPSLEQLAQKSDPENHGFALWRASARPTKESESFASGDWEPAAFRTRATSPVPVQIRKDERRIARFTHVGAFYANGGLRGPQFP